MIEQFSSSWTMTNPEASSQFLASAGFTPGMDNSRASERPLPVSRMNSAASTGSGLTMVSNTSFNGDDSFQEKISSAIHDAARITDWDTVKELCKQDPNAAKYVGKDRWTALHHACNRRCPRRDVAEALIRAYPDALLLEEEKGWYPLHYACRFKTPREVVWLLVHMYPEKGKKAVQKLDRQGRTPLYYAVRYDAPPGVVGILLDVDSSVVLEEDQNSDSPLGLVWDQWAEKIEGRRTLQRILGPGSVAETPEEKAGRVRKRLQSQSKVAERWANVNIFLQAAFGFAVGDDNEADGFTQEKKNSNGRKWRVLHATAAIKCHASLFCLACALFPEQASEFDENDLQGPTSIPGGWQTARHLSALHLAASSQAQGGTSRMVIEMLIALDQRKAEVGDDSGSLPLHRIVGNKMKPDWVRDGAEDLYNAFPGAVKVRNFEGQLPLHRAAAAIRPQGASSETTTARSVMCNLLQIYPDAAAHADNFGRLPMHIAVDQATEWDTQLQMLYDQYPQSLQMRTGISLGNMLPLHLAASSPISEPSLIQNLIGLYPRAASQTDRNGRLPLHYACEAGLPWESVKMIVESFPNAVGLSELNERGWNPLQLAAASRRSGRDLIANLAKMHPRSACEADVQGRYALHLACVSRKSWDDGMADIFDVHPDAISAADVLGLLPFHIACFSYGSAGNDKSLGNLVDSKAVLDRCHNRLTSCIYREPNQDETDEEVESTKHVDVLFHLAKADPTVLKIAKVVIPKDKSSLS